MIALRLVDVDMQDAVLWVRSGKGGKDRVVPVGRRAIEWLDAYLADVRVEWAAEADHGAVFVTRTGRPMTHKLVYQRCTRAVQRAGIDKPGHPHAWRHAAATVLLEGGASVHHVQAFLGHEQLNSTTRYTRVSIGALRAVHAQMHPFEFDERTEDN